MASFGGFLYAAILLLLCIFHVDVVRGQSTHPTEANALNAIKGGLIDPMNNLKNWNRGDPCTSNWAGVICSKIPSDTYLHVTKLEVFKMNLSGTLAPEVGLLSELKNLNFMWNNLTGNIPKEIGNISTLKLFFDLRGLSNAAPADFRSILHDITLLIQADNNNFSGSSIPSAYNNIKTLIKMSLRNCSLQGGIPDLSGLPGLGYLDLSWNQLTGSIPTNRLASNITTIDLSHNFLNGTIPANFSGLPNIQFLLIEANNIDGAVPLAIWSNLTYKGNGSLVLDFQNNSLDTIPDAFEPPKAVVLLLFGNPVCDASNAARAARLCQPTSVNKVPSGPQVSIDCVACSTDKNYEYNPSSPIPCICAVPVGVGFRLKSPGISDFRTHKEVFEFNSTSQLGLSIYQLYIEEYIWEAGPRLNMNLKLFPNNTNLFTMSEVMRLRQLLAGWEITLPDVFGPYELLNFTYADEFPTVISSGLSKGALAGILVGTVTAAIAVSVASTVFIMRKRSIHRTVSRRSLLSRFSVKVDGVRCFTFEEMARASNAFDDSAEVGQGGYGKVYKGKLSDGTAVAIKRAHEDSLQGSMEFCTEIELLSRLHHRNLVSLIGYCDEQCEQMLVYEFMPNGTLRDHLSVISKRPLNFGQRLHIALGAAKGILYLHTEADPPIFHRDVKATNILLDSKFVAKVADFGLSKLAPVPDGEGTLPAHISTIVRGTPGYLDPEYILTHKLTEKSDVYSLGVVLLELLTGMKPIQFGKNIVREVKSAYRSRDIAGILDSRMSSCPPECATRFLLLALKCCQDETDARPYMAEIVRELDGIRSVLPEEDLFSVNSTITGSSVTLANSAPDSQAATTRELFNSLQASSSGQAYSGILSGTVSPR